MYCKLRDNVYMIPGKKYACLYDLNERDLYHMNRELYLWLDKITKYAVDMENLKDYEKEALKQLLKLRLIEMSNDKTVDKKESEKRHNRINFAWIEVTTGCNLKCLHCYEEANNINNKQMSLEDYKLALVRLKKYGIDRIQIIGGEPLILGEKLKKMLELAACNFSDVEIFTNGTLITRNWAEFLKEHSIRVAVSIYSYNDTEHDKVTGVNGSCEASNRAIKMLYECGVNYRICNVLINGVNIGERNTHLYRLSLKKDIVRMSGRADFSLLSDELIRKKLITKERFTEKINPILFKKSMQGHNCFSSKIYISTDLDVFPCVMERRIKHGSIRNKSLETILKQDVLELNKNHIDGCKDCEYRYACFDCRANSLSTNVYEKPWYCTYNPYEGVWEDPKEYIQRLKLVYSKI